MRRRDFITLLSGTAASLPFTARAQQPTIPVVGFLHVGSPTPMTPQVEGFRKGLAETGYVVPQNLAIEYRWAEGHYDRLPALAADLVHSQVTVFVAGGGPQSALAAKAATSDIPILFVSGDDPVKYGIVASLSRPGGNITGAVFFNTALVAKRLELARELLRAADGIAFLVNPDSFESEGEAKDLQAAAQAAGQQITVLKASNAIELDGAFAELVQLRTKALLVGSDPFFVARRDQLTALAARYAVPTIYPQREFVAAGGLASYGTSVTDAYRLIGVYAGRILKGERPADLPVVQSTKFEFVINAKTAKALGLQIPDKLIALADEVID